VNNFIALTIAYEAPQSLNSPNPKRKRPQTSDDQEPSKKRTRNELTSAAQSSVTSPVFLKSPKATKRYGKKGRTSSPAPTIGEASEVSDRDEEILPPPAKAAPLKARVVDIKLPGRAKTTAMKAKGGKKVTNDAPRNQSQKQEQSKHLGETCVLANKLTH